MFRKRVFAFVLFASLGLVARASAQDAKATLSDFAWLTGHWSGPALGGTSEEMWTAPAGGAIQGMFRLVKDGKVVFYELLTLTERDGGVVLRLKHFNPDLTAWEEKAQVLEFPLIKITPTEAHFTSMVFRHADPDAFTVTLRMRDKQTGTVREELFTYALVRRFFLPHQLVAVLAQLLPRAAHRSTPFIVSMRSRMIPGSPMCHECSRQPMTGWSLGIVLEVVAAVHVDGLTGRVVGQADAAGPGRDARALEVRKAAVAPPFRCTMNESRPGGCSSTSPITPSPTFETTSQAHRRVPGPSCTVRGSYGRATGSAPTQVAFDGSFLRQSRDRRRTINWSRNGRDR